jgi:hypothetical protein
LYNTGRSSAGAESESEDEESEDEESEDEESEDEESDDVHPVHSVLSCGESKQACYYRCKEVEVCIEVHRSLRVGKRLRR